MMLLYSSINTSGRRPLFKHRNSRYGTTGSMVMFLRKAILTGLRPESSAFISLMRLITLLSLKSSRLINVIQSPHVDGSCLDLVAGHVKPVHQDIKVTGFQLLCLLSSFGPRHAPPGQLNSISPASCRPIQLSIPVRHENPSGRRLDIAFNSPVQCSEPSQLCNCSWCRKMLQKCTSSRQMPETNRSHVEHKLLPGSFSEKIAPHSFNYPFHSLLFHVRVKGQCKYLRTYFLGNGHVAAG